MKHAAFPDGVTRELLLDWYRRGRARTQELFALVTPAAYYERPITLRNPIVFYEGHFPAFAVNTLIKLAHGRKGIDARLEDLFARGIDPDSEDGVKDPTDVWPSREEVLAYGAAADALVLDALANLPLEDDAVPQLRGGEAVFTILEHEAMHHETLLYMLHNLPYEKKVPVVGDRSSVPRARTTDNGQRTTKKTPTTVRIPAGDAHLGTAADTFGWDNEFPSHVVHVDAFEVDAYDVTNGQYREYVEATGAEPPHFWRRVNGAWMRRALFALEPLPLDAPVYVTHEEAAAYARWRGRRLMTEAEWHRASLGENRGNYDFATWDPVAVGSFAPNDWGVYDLVGNGWEWTSTEFAPFPGFAPMPSYPVYSADFFDGAHYVLKGASPVTAKELVRPGFRNWFRPNYPYVFATFRTASGSA